MKNFVVALSFLVLLGACAKNASVNPTAGQTGSRNPRNYPKAADGIERNVVRRVGLSQDFIKDLQDLYGSSIEKNKACAQWTQVKSKGVTTDFLEFANSGLCSVKTQAIAESSVAFRVNMELAGEYFYKLYFDDQNKPVGEMVGIDNDSSSDVTTFEVSSVCTGSYLYGSNTNGCVLRVDYMGGFQDIITY